MRLMKVLQVYVKNHDCADADKHPELCAFMRIHLDAGEKKQIRIPVGHRALTVVGEDGIRRDNGKSYTFYVGCSQPDARSEELAGKRAVEIAYGDSRRRENYNPLRHSAKATRTMRGG